MTLQTTISAVLLFFFAGAIGMPGLCGGAVVWERGGGGGGAALVNGPLADGAPPGGCGTIREFLQVGQLICFPE